MTDEERIEKPSIFRFCKTHGYVYCKCPEDCGLSIAEFQAMQAKLKAAEAVVDVVKILQPLAYEVLNIAQSHGDYQAVLDHLAADTEFRKVMKAYDEATK